MHSTANVSSEPLTRAQTDIQINADWSQRCAIQSHDLPWLPSPSPLVQRRLLERDGGEVARATSVVRYAPGARFSAHPHDQGEEIFVLEGTFSDEDGNLHYSVYPGDPSEAMYDRVIEAIEDVVQSLGGSFSAEHGVGLSKLNSMSRRKDAVALDLMRTIKAAVDPQNLMNPGKVIPPK